MRQWFSGLLAAVTLLAPLPALAAPVDLGQMLSDQLVKCWNPPAHSTGSVVVRFDMSQDGHVVGTPKALGLASAGVASSAVHAVTFCAPYHLPPERYSDWQHAKVTLSTGP